MNCWKEYIEYLKDNPEGYWFKCKLYGFGWTPARPAGWITLGGYLVFLLGVMLYVKSFGGGAEISTQIIAVIVGATVLLSVIMWRTGEPLKWQWGRKQSER